MLEISPFLFALIISYLCGSIPFGYLLTKFNTGQDLRENGSKNIGATNVIRVGGKKLGIITFLLDGIKGILALVICFDFLNITNFWYQNIIIITIILGHVFPIWLKFKGGKGVATSFIIFLYISPVMFFVMLISWIIIYKIFNIVSLASIFAALSIFAYQLAIKDEFVFAAIIIAVIIIFRHIENVKRILSGHELDFKKEK